MRRIRTSAATTSVILAASLAATAPAQATPGDLDSSFSGDGRQITDFGGEGDAALGVAVQFDGKVVAVGLAGDDFALARYSVGGSLDTTFSGDGKETTDFGGYESGRAVAVQSDGKVVVGGTADGDFALARFSVGGSLDTTFSGDGRQTTDFGGYESGQAVAVQLDGKIVVGGDAHGEFALARYSTDGSLDTTFSGDGKQTIDFGAGYDAASDVAVQADGKVVAVGLGGGDFALARFTPDGSLDTTFSDDGKQTTDFAQSDDAAAGLAIQPDGRIVAVGYAGLEFSLARYSADGRLDATFSSDGKQTTAFGGLWGDTASAVALQPDGKIVVVGNCCATDLGGDFALARFNADGSLDTSFSGDGRQGTDFDGGDDAAWDVAIHSDGKIVVAGGTPGGGTGDFALGRYEGVSAPGAAPTNLSAPTITGSATEGQPLTLNAGTWSGSIPIHHSYQWRRCGSAGANCAEIAAATATTYTLTTADVGQTIRVRHAATNAYGQSSADSAATAVVKAKPGTIAGIVRNRKNGTALANASVNCGSGYSSKTTSGGRYSIPNVAPGTYRCTASANRYGSSMQYVTVNPGQTTTADFGLVRQ